MLLYFTVTNDQENSFKESQLIYVYTSYSELIFKSIIYMYIYATKGYLCIRLVNSLWQHNLLHIFMPCLNGRIIAVNYIYWVKH